APTLKQVTAREVRQGIGLGVFGGAGILFQVDGLAHTSASTSAFLTQCYCLLIPLWVAWRRRRWPALKVCASCVMVVIGVGILAGVDWRSLRLGRGELETIIASILFTGQIFLLERPEYSENDVTHFSGVMFATISLLALPIGLLSMKQPTDWIRPYSGI